MTIQLPTTLALASAAYVIYSLISTTVASHRNAVRARTLKCEEPPLQKNRYPFGIDNLQRSLAADKAQLFPADQIQRTIDVGAITYKYSILGTTSIFTADEKNVQAVLAVNFADFGESSSALLEELC